MLVRACQEDPEARAAAWSGPPPAGLSFARSPARSTPGPPLPSVRPPTPTSTGGPTRLWPSRSLQASPFAVPEKQEQSPLLALWLWAGPPLARNKAWCGCEGVSECVALFLVLVLGLVFPFARIRTHLHDVLRSLMSAAVPGGDYIDGGPMSLPREEAAALSSLFFLDLSLFLLVRFFPSLKRHSTLVICRRHCPSSANRTPPHIRSLNKRRRHLVDVSRWTSPGIARITTISDDIDASHLLQQTSPTHQPTHITPIPSQWQATTRASPRVMKAPRPRRRP